MMLDDELAALWDKETKREHSPAFAIAVMLRIERSLYRRAIWMNIAVVAAVTLFFAALAPLLTNFWHQTFAHPPSAPMLAILLSVISVLLVRLSKASGLATRDRRSSGKSGMD